MKVYITILIGICFSSSCLNSQELTLNKRNLYKVFKKSIRQNSRSKISVHSNPWMICNDDSSYFKSETLFVYPYSNNYPECECSCYISWTFYRRNKFIQTKEYIEEPRRIEVTDRDHYFRIKISKGANGLILSIYQGADHHQTFNVVAINNKIVLRRQGIN